MIFTLVDNDATPCSLHEAEQNYEITLALLTLELCKKYLVHLP